MSDPRRPKIYHITHVRNLPLVLEAGRIWSDAKRLELRLSCTIVGMSEIKRRRLEELPVHCHKGTMVGQYVPFYFCPRSIMLYILHQGNHPEITYREGQGPIVHLQADLRRVVAVANEYKVRWAFTNCNAGARYATFFNSMDRLGEVDWPAVEATDFRSASIKEGKQAEFLVYESFPWSLVERIGVANQMVLQQVQVVLAESIHQPPVAVERSWYF